MAKITLVDNKYYFDAQDGTAAVEVPVWLEKSKANEKHPNGKPWIKLPKGNPTNRAYFSEDLFKATAVDGSVEVEVKTAPPRVLGATGVKKDVIKYLDEADAAEYTALVDGALEVYKATKGQGKKKLEDMTEEELMAYIKALRSGEKFVAAEGPKSFLDTLNEDQYNRYNELLAKAAENKANAPKAPRRKLTEAEKAARAEKRTITQISKAQALLDALRAPATPAVEEDEDFEDEE